MAMIFDPVRTWVRYGVADLYFAHANQSNDVYRYGTFFFIMAAEKHLKAVLIRESHKEYVGLDTLEEKRRAVENIARRYSHHFNRMIAAVAEIYEREIGRSFMEIERFGYDVDDLLRAMYEGYMETRYPTAVNTFRHFPFPNSEGAYHDPLGSSFFTDFLQDICRRCWHLLIHTGLDGRGVIDFVTNQFRESRDFDVFESVYLKALPTEL